MENTATGSYLILFFFGGVGGGVESSPLILRSQLAYYISPVWWWMMMSVEHSVLWLPRETEVLGEILPSSAGFTTNPTWPDSTQNEVGIAQSV
jgi:hypothetical protein